MSTPPPAPHSMPPPQAGKERKPWVFPVVGSVIAVVIGVAIAAAVIFAAGGFSPRGPAEIVRVTHSPQNPLPGETINVKIEAKNAVECGLQHVSFFEYSWNYTPPTGNIQLPDCEADIGPFENETEVWYVVSALGRDGKLVLSQNHTIQIGHVERSDITTLGISNVEYTPQNPTIDDYQVELLAKITSNVSVLRAWTKYIIITPTYISGSGGSYLYQGAGNLHIGGINFYDHFEHLSHCEGCMILFRIAAEDSAGNTALSEVFSISVY